MKVRGGINISRALYQLLTTFDVDVHHTREVEDTGELRFDLAVVKVPEAVADTFLVTGVDLIEVAAVLAHPAAVIRIEYKARGQDTDDKAESQKI